MRRYLITMLFLLLSLFAVSTSASADENDILSFVSSATSDRVHLRAQPSTKSKSLGLYYVGTPVIVVFEDPRTGWSEVMIGAEKGYMYTQLLTEAAAPKKLERKWKKAAVAVAGGADLHTAPRPDAPVIERMAEKREIAFLGETVDRWCYVKCGNKYGYVPSRCLHTTEAIFEETGYQEARMPFATPCSWCLTSGAGAWSSVMVVLEDGSFWGYYHDSDMGDAADDYPNGTLYECSFTGKFTKSQMISEKEDRMKVESFQMFGAEGQKMIWDKQLVITIDACGVSDDEAFVCYHLDLTKDVIPDELLENGIGFFDGCESISLLYGCTGKNVWY